MARRARRLLVAVLAVLAMALGPILLADLAGAKDSVCYGTPANGRIEGAVRMPPSGENFRAYCGPCILALRTFGHDLAVGAVSDAYRALESTLPDVTFVYGEIGLPGGGRFAPHRTHQNGLSFDFMVPLIGKELPTTVANRFGYDEEFDAEGRGPSGVVDFAAVAAHLNALDASARSRGGRISRVILAPDLQDELFRADPALRGALRFNINPVWVRHDDHYHVDLDFPCEE